jgi:lysophospholipase L1-like esterase
MSAWKVTSVFASIIACLTAVSMVFPKEGITIGDHSYYLPTIQDLTEANTTGSIDIGNAKNIKIPKEITALSDSIDYLQTSFDQSDLRLWLPNESYLDDFWTTAENAVSDNRVVRILHYGDSQIEMDRISYQLRAYMQQHFGGGGPGMLPFSTIIASTTVSQSASGSLTHLASFGDSTVVRSRGNYGTMMQCFRMDGNASMSVRASSNAKTDSRFKKFSRIRLVYNDRRGNLKATLSEKKKKRKNISYTSKKVGVGSMLWTLDSATTAFNLNVVGSADLYCVTVDNGPGVAVDNIPMRGCSGSQFTSVDKNLLAQSYTQLDVAMIILQFGGNSVPYLKSKKSISNYCNTIGKQIDYVHQCCPKAKILFVGPSDMSTSERGKLQTYPMLPALIDSLRVTSNRHGAAFWSIYHAQGGWNSMLSWKKQGLSGSDYVHFTPKGAAMMGDRLSTAFDNSYRLYTMKRRLKAIKK